LLCYTLSHVLFRYLVDLGHMTADWKLANITHILRPTSVTLVFSKPFERAMPHDSLKYFYDNELITSQQNGLLARHSTCSQLFEGANDWSSALCNCHHVDVVYFDTFRAFDNVSQN